MSIFRAGTLVWVVVAVTTFPQLFAQSSGGSEGSAATIQRVAVLGAGGATIEIEISATRSITPKVQLIAGPNRLVLDFSPAHPAGDLRNVVINRSEVTGIRVGLFASNPPTTRVVLDLKSPLEYQLFPSGDSLIVKLIGTRSAPAERPTELVFLRDTAPPDIQAPPTPPPPKVQVRFQKGLLSIQTDRATLAEVLLEVKRRTGADIDIPPGAQQEMVVTQLGPGPPEQVLASLLNGSPFNFIVLGSERDPAALGTVLIMPKGSGLPGTAVIPQITPVSPVPQFHPAQPAGADLAPDLPPDTAPEQEAPEEPPQ